MKHQHARFFVALVSMVFFFAANPALAQDYWNDLIQPDNTATISHNTNIQIAKAVEEVVAFIVDVAQWHLGIPLDKVSAQAKEDFPL
jgi:hypothetical protein